MCLLNIVVFHLILCEIVKSISIKYLRSLTPLQVAELTKNEFIWGYTAYKNYAWGCDELYPVSKKCRNMNKHSLMWTPIDSLDTLYLMGIDELLSDTIDLLCSTSFNGKEKFTFNTDQSVFAFDYFLRSLGGLISAYHFTNNQCLKDLAVELAELVYPIFNEVNPSLSGLPWTNINLHTGKIAAATTTGPAVAGTHVMEMGMMSIITGDMKYFKASINAMRVLYEARSNLGLIGNEIWINKTSDIHSTELFASNKSQVDAGTDSYYEYIVKCWALFDFEECKDWWLDVINSSIIEHLSFYNQNSNNGEELLWFKRVDMFTGKNTPDWDSYDLYAAFYSGVLSLSAIIDPMDENNKYNLHLAKLSQEANYFMWNKSHIEPFVYGFDRDNDDQANYDLNPENFESNYYLYMITNDQKYYDRALIYLHDLIKYCKCKEKDDCAGYTGLSNVHSKARANSLPSYFFAESMKYLYLTFMRNEENNPLPFDEYVFNTECHPFPKSMGRQLNSLLKKERESIHRLKQRLKKRNKKQRLKNRNGGLKWSNFQQYRHRYHNGQPYFDNERDYEDEYNSLFVDVDLDIEL